MLTHEQIRKAGRLMQQIGELRPGFLKDQASGLEGPYPRKNPYPEAAKKRKVGTKKTKSHLVFKEDPNTGDIRIVYE